MTDIDLRYLLRDELMGQRPKQAWDQARQIDSPIPVSSLLLVCPPSYLLSVARLEADNLSPYHVLELVQGALLYTAINDPISILIDDQIALEYRLLTLIKAISRHYIHDVLRQPFLDWILTSNQPFDQLIKDHPNPDLILPQLNAAKQLINSSRLLTFWFHLAFVGRTQVPTYTSTEPNPGPLEYIGTYLPMNQLSRYSRLVPEISSMVEYGLEERLDQAYIEVAQSPALILDLVQRQLLTPVDLELIMAEAMISRQSRVVGLLLDRGWISLDQMRFYYLGLSHLQVISQLDLSRLGLVVTFLDQWNYNNTWDELLSQPTVSTLTRSFVLLSSWIADDLGASIFHIGQLLLNLGIPEEPPIFPFDIEYIETPLLDYLDANQIPRQRYSQWYQLYKQMGVHPELVLQAIRELTVYH